MVEVEVDHWEWERTPLLLVLAMGGLQARVRGMWWIRWG